MLFNNFVSPLKTTINPCNQSTNIVKDNSFINESLNLKCALYHKIEKSPIEQLSDNCTIYMKIINENSFDYCLNIKNNKKDSTWNFFQILINGECKIFILDKMPELKCFMLYKNNTFYIFELSDDDINNNKRKNFLEKFEILQISSNSKISINEVMKEKQKGAKNIIKCKNINELNEFLENYLNNEGNETKSQNLAIPRKSSFYLNLYDNTIKSSDFIDKSEFMNNFSMYKEIYMCRGTAFKYNKYTESVIPIEDDQNEDKDDFSLLKINKIGFNKYILVLEKNNNILAFTKIENNFDISINEEYGTMTFISQNINNKEKTYAYTFSFKDKSLKEINYLKNLILRCLYENDNYIEDILEYPIISTFDYTTNNIDYEEIEDNYSFLSSKSKIIDIGQYSVIKNISSKENTKNKSILQSYNNNRTFAIKDNSEIDIFQTNNDDNQLINISSISPIKTIKDNNDYNNSQDIIISKAKIFNKDNEILFQDSKNKNIIYQYDLNKENLIQEWDCNTNNISFNIRNNNIDNKNMIDFTYPQKLAQLNGQNEMIGINSNNIFLLDGRVNRKNKIVDIKNFSINPQFKCVITTGNGGIATGSENGDIRLFNEIGNAKTLITGFNNPIRYLDSSVDGKYILATCDKSIMVINTDNEHNLNGFNSCFGRINIKPLILKLSQNDLIKYKLDKEVFTPAKFNNNTNSKEIMIISSLGQYVILWNFKQVQNGHTDSYRIINANQFVIDNTTKFDKNQLIIALPDKLRLQNEKFLQD